MPRRKKKKNKKESILKILLILSLFLLCNCESYQGSKDNITYLKELGYKEINCNLHFVEDEIINYYEFYIQVYPIKDNLEMLAARCYDGYCYFEQIQENTLPSKYVCQRFYDDEEFSSEFDKDQTLLFFNVEKFIDIKE